MNGTYISSSQPHGIDASRSLSPIQKEATVPEISAAPETGCLEIKNAGKSCHMDLAARFERWIGR
jgi:hypothetical protein